jgi:hypothetical protein
MSKFKSSGFLSIFGMFLTILGSIITGFADKKLIEESVEKILCGK